MSARHLVVIFAIACRNVEGAQVFLERSLARRAAGCACRKESKVHVVGVLYNEILTFSSVCIESLVFDQAFAE